MAAIFEQSRTGTLFLGGQKISGADIRDQNGMSSFFFWWFQSSRDHADQYIPTVLATQAIANVVKSSFGPSGLDKMMVDDIGVSGLSLSPIR